MRTFLIAHRGDTVNFSENTIESFSSAFEKGADGIELDFQYQYGQLIIVHDYLYDRSRTFPLLSDVLKRFSSKGRIEIEVKSMDLEFINPLKELLNTYKEADFEITTSVFPLVRYLRPEFPDIPIGVIFNEKEFEGWMTEDFIITKVTKMMKLFQANRAHMPNKLLDKKMIDECHTNNFKVHGHVYKQSMSEQIDLYKRFVNLGVDQCTFDDISLLDALKN